MPEPSSLSSLGFFPGEEKVTPHWKVFEKARVIYVRELPLTPICWESFPPFLLFSGL